MNLTPAETTLIDILRSHPSLILSITKADEGVLITMASPGDGVNVGAGANFERAFFDLCGREMPTDVLGEAASQAQN